MTGKLEMGLVRVGIKLNIKLLFTFGYAREILNLNLGMKVPFF